MSDQDLSQKPALSLEEELDVLEAVYKVGKEKGLDLLRPEQIKKLMESGRAKVEGEIAGDERGVKKNSLDNVRVVVRNMISTLLSQYPEITQTSEWESFSKDEKEQVARTLFGIHFGIAVEELSVRVNALLASDGEPNYG